MPSFFGAMRRPRSIAFEDAEAPNEVPDLASICRSYCSTPRQPRNGLQKAYLRRLQSWSRPCLRAWLVIASVLAALGCVIWVVNLAMPIHSRCGTLSLWDLHVGQCLFRVSATLHPQPAHFSCARVFWLRATKHNKPARIHHKPTRHCTPTPTAPAAEDQQRLT